MALLSLAEIRRVEADDRSTARAVVGAAWAVAGLTGAVVQLVSWRQRRLILRDPRQRAENSARIRAALGTWVVLAVGLALLTGTLAHTVRGAVFGLLGGLALSFSPALLWIAFFLRPEERRGEEL